MKDSIADYLGCALFKGLGPLIRFLPKAFSLFLGRRLGDIMFYLDLKHKAVAYANIKVAFGARLGPRQLSQLTRRFFQAFGQNLIELFFIPAIDKEYINKYIAIEGINHIDEGFKRGKGVILLGVHAGSWELSSIICANLGFPFSLFIQDQRLKRLNELLNKYRRRMGCGVIQRKAGARQLVGALKHNQAIGITADQGGKRGVRVKFFGATASMSAAAVKLALKHDAVLIPGFSTRSKGPYLRTILKEPFRLKRTGNFQKDVRENLQEITRIFEGLIERYPQEYLWSYKIWKYSSQRKILILSDGKAGHLRQSQLIANTLEECLKARSIHCRTQTVEARFKHRLLRLFLLSAAGLSGRYHCQGCLWCLRRCLTEDSYRRLTGLSADYIISTGSSLAAVNFILSRENNGKSVVNMRPSALSTKRFDLVIMPAHDRPPKRKNIAVTEGALNLIDEQYLQRHKRDFASSLNLNQQENNCIGILIGGDSKNFTLDEQAVLTVLRQVRSAAASLGADILLTTSRRTSASLERLIKKELENCSHCKALIIANEKNIPSAVSGILGLSKLALVSAESISMISEAVASHRHVVVFKSGGLNKRQRRFAEYFSQKKYIILSEPEDIGATIENVYRKQVLISPLQDKATVQEAIKRLL